MFSPTTRAATRPHQLDSRAKGSPSRGFIDRHCQPSKRVVIYQFAHWIQSSSISVSAGWLWCCTIPIDRWMDGWTNNHIKYKFRFDQMHALNHRTERRRFVWLSISCWFFSSLMVMGMGWVVESRWTWLWIGQQSFADHQMLSNRIRNSDTTAQQPLG